MKDIFVFYNNKNSNLDTEDVKELLLKYDVKCDYCIKNKSRDKEGNSKESNTFIVILDKKDFYELKLKDDFSKSSTYNINEYIIGNNKIRDEDSFILRIKDSQLDVFNEVISDLVNTSLITSQFYEVKKYGHIESKDYFIVQFRKPKHLEFTEFLNLIFKVKTLLYLENIKATWFNKNLALKLLTFLP